MTGSESSQSNPPDGADERRIAPRIAERCSIAFRAIRDGAAAARTTAETVNLSASGLCLVSPHPLSRDDHLALELSLDGHDAPLVAVGRVVWCDRENDGYRAGVCFTWLRDEDRKALAIIGEYVQERLGS